jgi:hypothetical protein
VRKPVEGSERDVWKKIIAKFVIASEAKQSIGPQKGRMDCFVATLLAMTQVEPQQASNCLSCFCLPNERRWV